ncbi:hypothetical protein [Chryseobacterium luquanense]|uniref:GLPGLI family protein n=1 Tax=Chryseobacterium luquanense TaxID=2983766 RepID=A0ABT3Y8A1_9FLAO|nr:hypothetical protein [Chryseobacterium luquanense]MCX8534404.1 hypothetical protein [Chryseobacterium luquanense]
MKTKLTIILFLFFNIIFSQDKQDSIVYIYNKTLYKEKALSFVKKMVEANNKYGNRRKDLIYDIADIELVIHPVFTFKKIIKDDNGTTNLLQYINFESKPEKQIVEVYSKGKFIYTFYLPNDKLDEISKGGDINILLGDLDLPKNYINGFNPPDYNILFKDKFSFYINNTFCVVIDDKIFVIEEITLPTKHLKIEEFNSYFFPILNELKNEAKGVTNAVYSDYIFKGPINPTFLKVLYK